MSICKLCLIKKKLIKKSHIIPNFMYKGVLDKNHSIIRFTTMTPNSDTKLHTGEFESNILCQDCENFISQFESYGNLILYGGRKPKNVHIEFLNQTNQHGVEFTYASGLDYIKFKLFLFSILWKMSISQRPFFNQVQLGKYQEQIRKMLVFKDPGKQTDFPCIITTYRKHKSLPKELITQPKKTRLQTGIGYHLMINGFLYYFYVSPNVSRQDWISQAAINEAGELRVIHIPEHQSKKIINKYFGLEYVK